jgi:hypothetical protein
VVSAVLEGWWVVMVDVDQAPLTQPKRLQVLTPVVVYSAVFIYLPG